MPIRFCPVSRSGTPGSSGLLRNSEIEFQEKSEDLQKVLRRALVQRQLGEVIRLEISASLPESARQLVIEELKIDRDEVVVVDGLFALADISQLIVKDRPDLLYKPFEIRVPERISEYGNDCFAAISSKDIVVHHPYESFDIVLQYIRQAASDPDVVAIKWTLYRTSQKSPIVEALRQAREAGKSVTVMIEVMARFDELANLEWAKQLEACGVHVVYGLTQLDLKTHAKLGQVVRKENGELRTYSHVGTGNYHPATARVYTDLSYFTADPAVGRDLTKIFNYVTTYSRPNDLERTYISPHGIKARILEEIEAEIRHRKAGWPAAIWMKLNALVDADVIDSLYEASLSGVPVDLVIRGICCLKPGIPGLSENIRAKSIIGRFPGAFTHLLFWRGARVAIRRRPCLYQLRRHDAAQPGAPGRGDDRHNEPHRSRANPRPDHDRQSERQFAKLEIAKRRLIRTVQPRSGRGAVQRARVFHDEPEPFRPRRGHQGRLPPPFCCPVHSARIR